MNANSSKTQVKTRPNQTDTGLKWVKHAQTYPNRPTQAKIGPNKPKQAQTGPNRPKKAQTGLNRPKQAQTGPNRPKQAQTGPCLLKKTMEALFSISDPI